MAKRKGNANNGICIIWCIGYRWISCSNESIYSNKWFDEKRKKIPEFAGEIGSKVRAGKKILLYFYSPSCGACRPMTPVIEEMKKNNSNVYKVNLTKDMKLGKIFGVMGTPATILVENSKITKFILGARTENYIKSLI